MTRPISFMGRDELIERIAALEKAGADLVLVAQRFNDIRHPFPPFTKPQTEFSYCDLERWSTEARAGWDKAKGGE